VSPKYVGQRESRAWLSRGWEHAKLLHETERIIVGGMSGNFPVPDLKHLTNVQLEFRPVGGSIDSFAVNSFAVTSLHLTKYIMGRLWNRPPGSGGPGDRAKLP
jgi:hypothetical protein